MPTITTNAQLVETVQELADAFFQPRKDFNGDVHTATSASTDISNAARIDVDFHGRLAYIYLSLACDGGLDLRIHVFPGRGGYATRLLPEDATVEKVKKHVQRAVPLMEQQLADAKRRDTEREAEMAAARAGR